MLHRAYWSLQAAGPDGFRATTLELPRRRATARRGWSSPRTPSCPALARPAPAAQRVLRYMPLRRCTSAREAGGRARVSCKVKRPHRAAEAWGLLQARASRARATAARASPSPAPLALRPGPRDSGADRRSRATDLSGSSTPTAARTSCAGRRAAPRDARGRRSPASPPEDPGQALRRAARRRALGRVRAARARGHGARRSARARAPCARPPARARLLPRRPRAVAAARRRRRAGRSPTSTAPGSATRTATSRSGSPRSRSTSPRWTRAAEAGDEATIERAEAAYLDGYGPHDERRLLWHRAAAEVHSVAVALKKDRHEPARARAACGSRSTCAEALA